MLLERLKQHTHAQHSALEKLNGLPATFADYVAQLESFHGFVAPWEERLATALPDDDPIRVGRAKTAWLEADLAHFGHSRTAIAALPRCTELPSIASRNHTLGAAYVLEGSTLGGQFISRHLAQVLQLAPGAGDRYFRSYGAQVGPMWQAFRQELLRGSSADADSVIVAAAQDTFAKLHAWFAARSVAA